MRLWSQVGGTWQWVDYIYNSSGGGNAIAVMLDPSPGVALPAGSATFRWSAGSGVTAYWLYVGTSVGAANLHDSNGLSSTSRVVSGLPAFGVVHVRLWSEVGGTWLWADYVYNSGSGGGGQALHLDAVGSVSNPWTYDEAGRLKSIPGHVTGFLYNARGQVVTAAYANGVVTTNQYDFVGASLRRCAADREPLVTRAAG